MALVIKLQEIRSTAANLQKFGEVQTYLYPTYDCNQQISRDKGRELKALS
jgi:hypothetical protein